MAKVPGIPPVSPEEGVTYAYIAALGVGLYLATFVFTLRWLLFSDEGWKPRKAISWPMVSIAVFMFMLIIAYSALSLKSVLDQVRLLATSGEKYTIPGWLSVCKCMLANSTALTADVVFVYRCFVVYGGNLRIIAFPCFLWVGSLICTGIELYLEIAHFFNPKIGPYTWASVNMTFGPGIVLTPFWAASAVLNVYCTTMLVRRIYQVCGVSGGTSAVARHLRFVARLIAESGFIATSVSLACFVVWFTADGFAIEAVAAINILFFGIAFNLILIRAADRRADSLDEKATGVLSSIKFGTSDSFVEEHSTDQQITTPSQV